MECRVLSTLATGGPVGVDRDNAVIQGYVVAESGTFKSERGAFDSKALKSIVQLMDGRAVPSRLGHRGFFDDRPGWHLGRAMNPRMDGPDKVRADLHLSKASFKSPHGDLGSYVLDLASEDKAALSSSLVLHAEDEFQKGSDRTPIWRPTEILGSDIVDEGDAVGSLLAHQEDRDLLPQSQRILAFAITGKTRSQAEEMLGEHISKVIYERYGDRDPELIAEIEEARRIGMKLDIGGMIGKDVSTARQAVS